MDRHQIYEKILQDAKDDSNIVGFILVGGRGKGMSTERSDYDIIMVVSDGKKFEYEEKYEKQYNATEVIELRVLDVIGFRNYANWGQEDAVYGHTFAHLKAQVDKTGEIQKLINRKGSIPEQEVKKFVREELDRFINYYYRALKNNRDGNELAAHLDAAESVPALINIFFGLDGRLRPYNKFFEWELKTHPLTDLPWQPEEFIQIIQKLLVNGDIGVIKEVYEKVKEVLSEQGYSEIIQGWDGYKME